MLSQIQPRGAGHGYQLTGNLDLIAIPLPFGQVGDLAPLILVVILNVQAIAITIYHLGQVGRLGRGRLWQDRATIKQQRIKEGTLPRFDLPHNTDIEGLLLFLPTL